MQLILDAKKPKSPRMFFLLEENRNVLNHSLTLDKNDQSCKTFNVYLKVLSLNQFLQIFFQIRLHFFFNFRTMLETS